MSCYIPRTFYLVKAIVERLFITLTKIHKEILEGNKEILFMQLCEDNPKNWSQFLDFVPKPGAFIGLFGENLKRRWAYFEKPPGFSQNRVFFFGVSNALDKCKADSQRIASIDCSHTDAKEQAERQKEKNTLATNNTLVTTLHEDYEYIMGRTHHFVQA